MKVFVAAGYGGRGEDFCWVPDGELLSLNSVVCASQCGCERAFSGTQTLKATTTGKVCEIDTIDLVDLARDVGARSGFGEASAHAQLVLACAAADQFAVGDVVRPWYDFEHDTWRFDAST